jgi:hypothetical protein
LILLGKKNQADKEVAQILNQKIIINESDLLPPPKVQLRKIKDQLAPLKKGTSTVTRETKSGDYIESFTPYGGQTIDHNLPMKRGGRGGPIGGGKLGAKSMTKSPSTTESFIVEPSPMKAGYYPSRGGNRGGTRGAIGGRELLHQGMIQVQDHSVDPPRPQVGSRGGGRAPPSPLLSKPKDTITEDLGKYRSSVSHGVYEKNTFTGGGGGNTREGKIYFYSLRKNLILFINFIII